MPMGKKKPIAHNPKFDFNAAGDSIRASERNAAREFLETGKRGAEYDKYQKRLNEYSVQMATHDSAKAANFMKKVRGAEQKGRANDLFGGELTNMVDYEAEGKQVDNLSKQGKKKKP